MTTQAATPTAPAATGQRILVIDDELPALTELSYLLRNQPGVAAVDNATDATAALRLLRDNEYAAVFLDIRMPGLDGMELARILRRFAEPPALVFVTAYADYAVDAFEVEASDYLLKPVSPERLAAALAKLRVPRTAADIADDLTIIPVDVGSSTHWIKRDDVCWAEAQGDYVRLHTADGAGHLVRLSLALLQERWSAAGFVRIHRGYLVSLRRVSELRTEPGGGHLAKVAGRELPVSRAHLRELKERLVRVARHTPSD